MSENEELMKIFGIKQVDVSDKLRVQYNEGLCGLYWLGQCNQRRQRALEMWQGKGDKKCIENFCKETSCNISTLMAKKKFGI
jgi:hypothetical protein